MKRIPERIIYSKQEAREAIERLSMAAGGYVLPLDKKKVAYMGYDTEEVKEHNVPLLCETSLYPLLGKDEARSILGDLRILAEYLGAKKADF